RFTASAENSRASPHHRLGITGSTVRRRRKAPSWLASRLLQIASTDHLRLFLWKQAEAARSANCRGTVGPTLVTRGGSNGFQELFVTSRGNWKTNCSRHRSRPDGGDVAGSESRRRYFKRHRRQRTAGDLECRGRI